jgi:hypothetical protein
MSDQVVCFTPHLTGPISLLVPDLPVFHRDGGLRRWWAIAKCTVLSFCVVVFSPFFDQDLGLRQGIENLPVEQFVPEPTVAAFTISVLPRASRFDVGNFKADGCDPIPNRLCNKLGTIKPSELC